MRIAPDVVWTAFATTFCATVLALLCASVALATRVDWSSEPTFAAIIAGRTDDVVRFVGRKTSGPVWVPRSLRSDFVRISGSTSGYLVRLDESARSTSFGAHAIGRAAAIASVLDLVEVRQRLTFLRDQSFVALTPRIIARVTHLGRVTDVTWQARGWTFDVSDLSVHGYALARTVQAYVQSHSWPAGPGCAIVERAADTRNSWTAWAAGASYVGVASLGDDFTALEMTSAMRAFR